MISREAVYRSDTLPQSFLQANSLTRFNRLTQGIRYPRHESDFQPKGLGQ